MHSGLEAALQRMRDVFFSDDRCWAMYITGSLAKKCADEFSDIDVGIVAPPEHYAALKADIQGICERTCGRIVAWLPEGEQPEYVNYAFLFECGDHLLLCDLMTVTTGVQAAWPPLQAHQVLFDKHGILCVTEPGDQAPAYSQADLSMTLRTYWVYAYLDGKYYQRRDVFKMLYVQYALFLQHVNVFKAFRPDLEWGWWAKDVQYVPEANREELLLYFGATRIEDILPAFRRALNLFSSDAQLACKTWNMEYPFAMEQGVRAHLMRMGVLE